MSEAQVAVVVQDAAVMDQVFTTTWDGMNAALLAGDKATALTFLTASAQVKYGPVFDVLLPHMAEIVASYSPPQRFLVSTNIAEYAINRVIDGENRLFLISFVKDASGAWRIDGM
ncbi:MAG: hypothetical protein FJ147_25885 [Deltaproteobacteria bacterium]|nr:hypothetical protein [Deltaproteobacteria bacterium]